MGAGKDNAYITFQENINNPGGGKFLPGTNSGSETSRLRVIQLDSLYSSRQWNITDTEIAVMKVDVEGLEWHVLQGASELLRSGIVHNLFVEVTVHDSHQESDTIALVEFMVDRGYALYKYGEWPGPDKHAPLASEVDIPKFVVNTTMATVAKQLNLWFQLEKK